MKIVYLFYSAILLFNFLVYPGSLDGIYQTHSESEWAVRLVLLDDKTALIESRSFDLDKMDCLIYKSKGKWKYKDLQFQIFDSTKLIGAYDFKTLEDALGTKRYTLEPIKKLEGRLENINYRFYKVDKDKRYQKKWEALGCELDLTCSTGHTKNVL